MQSASYDEDFNEIGRHFPKIYMYLDCGEN